MRLNKDNEECLIELNRKDVNTLWTYFNNAVVLKSTLTTSSDASSYHSFMRALDLANTVEEGDNNNNDE